MENAMDKIGENNAMGNAKEQQNAPGKQNKTHEIKRGNQALTIFRLVLNPMISNCKTFQKSRH